MTRALHLAAVIFAVGMGLTIVNGWVLVVIGIVLAYLLGRSDEYASRERGRGGYLHATGEHPYGVVPEQVRRRG